MRRVRWYAAICLSSLSVCSNMPAMLTSVIGSVVKRKVKVTNSSITVRRMLSLSCDDVTVFDCDVIKFEEDDVDGDLGYTAVLLAVDECLRILVLDLL